jgi:cobalt/nickel transport system permease protein
VEHGTLERYLRGTSLIHRLDPRLKVLAVLAYVLVTTSTPVRAWPAFLWLAALAGGAILLSRIPLVEALRRSAIALPFAGMAAISLPFTRAGQVLWAWHPFGWHIAITDQGVLSFATLIVKSWLSVLVSGLLVATTPFPDLLVALRALGAPTLLAAILSFTVRYLFVLVDEAMRMQRARQARSAGPGGTLLWRVRVLGGMIGSLFIRSYERSERIYAAMLSRGFDGQVRTLTRLRWRALDSWATLCWGLLTIGAAILTHAL